jgi:hypothetical protein
MSSRGSKKTQTASTSSEEKNISSEVSSELAHKNQPKQTPVPRKRKHSTSDKSQKTMSDSEKGGERKKKAKKSEKEKHAQKEKGKQALLKKTPQKSPKKSDKNQPSSVSLPFIRV